MMSENTEPKNQFAGCDTPETGAEETTGELW